MNTRDRIEQMTGIRRSPPVNKFALNFMVEHMKGCSIPDKSKCHACKIAYRRAFPK